LRGKRGIPIAGTNISFVQLDSLGRKEKLSASRVRKVIKRLGGELLFFKDWEFSKMG